MTQQELQALVLLLNRIPLSVIEQLWLQDFLARYAPKQETKEQ